MTRPTRVRYLVLSLTVAAYMVTYMDRVAIGVAAPSIQKDFGFSLITMGWLFAAFRWGYTLTQIPGGWLGDRIGPRRALTLFLAWWSVFTCATGLAWNVASMAVFRFLLGVGEAGAFPTATRSLSRWMLPTERGFAQGMTHSGSRVGAALAPPFVVLLIGALGWRAPFVVLAGMGFIWASIWALWYRDTPEEHGWLNEGERELIRSSLGGGRSAKTVSVPWGRILSSPTLWTLSTMYGLYGYCIAIYLDWFPKYLNEHRGFSLTEMGFYAGIPFLAATVGDLAGGWSSDAVAKRTGNLLMARRVVACAGFVTAAAGILAATLAENSVTSVLLTCIGIFGLEATVGVSWAIPLDIGGEYAGSVSAVMNTLGNAGAALSPTLLAYLVKGYGWNAPFLVASVLCMIAALLWTRIDATRRIFPEGMSEQTPRAGIASTR